MKNSKNSVSQDWLIESKREKTYGATTQKVIGQKISIGLFEPFVIFEGFLGGDFPM